MRTNGADPGDQGDVSTGAGVLGGDKERLWLPQCAHTVPYGPKGAEPGPGVSPGGSWARTLPCPPRFPLNLGLF